MPMVLVVEDDASIRRLLEALLATAGHEVFLAMDGAEALDIARDQVPDLVFLDLTLPDISGWDVLAAMRALPSPPPVVLLTGDEAAVRGARAAGAAGALLKPFDIDDLLEITTRLLGR